MKMRIYAAKININQNIFNYNIEDLIPLISETVMNSHNKYLETKTCKWVITSVKKINDNESEYITGKLCKIKKYTKTKEFNEDIFDSEEIIINNVTYESVFLLDGKHELIVFEEVNEINKSDFMKQFEQLCYMITPTLGQLKIKLYPKTADINQILSKVEKVYYAKFNIIPANYTSKNGFKKLDDIMKDEKISELNSTLKNQDGDINITEGSIFSQCMEMVKSAYGTFKIKIKNKNSKQKKTIDSECTVYKKDIRDGNGDYLNEFISLAKEIVIDNSIKK